MRTVPRIESCGHDVIHGQVRWSPAKSLWLWSMTTAALVGGALTFSWHMLALFLGMTAMVLLLGHSLGSHRKLIHNSFQCPKWLEYALVYAGVQVGLAGPLGLLRQHELRDYAQRQPDCHDYLRHGGSFWADGWRQLHCDLLLDQPPRIGLEPSIAHDRFYHFLERTWMLQQLPPALLLYLAAGLPGVIWGVCARIAAAVTGHWLIGYFAHNHGPMHNQVRGAAVQGHNIPLASLLTMGESWHNNHHAFPGSARLGLYPGEWDPGWWTLVLLCKAGLAWDVILPEHLPARPALQPLDAAAPAASAPAPSTVGATVVAGVALLARRSPAHLRGPCLARCLQSLVGKNAVLTRVPGMCRLELHTGTQVVRGLPALALAIGSRNAPAAAAALLVMPAALLCEAVRDQFQYRHATD